VTKEATSFVESRTVCSGRGADAVDGALTVRSPEPGSGVDDLLEHVFESEKAGLVLAAGGGSRQRGHLKDRHPSFIADSTES